MGVASNLVIFSPPGNFTLETFLWGEEWLGGEYSHLYQLLNSDVDTSKFATNGHLDI